MKPIILPYVHFLLLVFLALFSMAEASAIENNVRSESYYLQLIDKVDHKYTFSELSNIIKDCENQFIDSEKIAIALTGWLRENHNIYKERSAINVNQFRGHIIYRLRKFVPTNSLFMYVKSELTFSHEQYNLATAAHASRILPMYSDELIPLLIPLVEDVFNEDVDITTYELNYPINNITKLRYEVIATLKYFAKTSSRAEMFIKNLNLKDYNDSTTIGIIQEKKATPSCCMTKIPDKNCDIDNGLIMSDKRVKRKFKSSFLDQNGKKMKFSNLIGKPFVLTFFYTSCTNPLKCAATVSRLARLQNILKLNDEVGLYAMSYDYYIDNPSVIKTYGEIYGMKFSENIKFFTTPENQNYNTIYSQLDVRVNYGSGTINQHGIQLYIFDKKGRIAKIIENKNWTVTTVSNYLFDLLKE